MRGELFYSLIRPSIETARNLVAIAQDWRTPAETRNANDSRTQFSEISSSPNGIHNPGELKHFSSHFSNPVGYAMSNRSLSDLPSQQRRERIAAVLARAWPAFWTKGPKSRQTLVTQALSFSLESGSLCLRKAGGERLRPEGKHSRKIGESTMNAAMASEIARLETMTITKVVERFESLFGEKCLSRNERYWIRRIARRLQANAEGNLSE